MKKQRIILLLLLLSAPFALPLLTAQENVVRRYDFDNHLHLKRDWIKKGKQFGIPMTRFAIVRSRSASDAKVLAVEANRSSGILMTRIEKGVWEKYPVLRWRWRVIRKVRFSGKELDDQAAVIYFGDGSPLKQYQVAYRWEHDFPLESRSVLKYSMGATVVARICVRNKNAVSSQWYEEERNVVEDFRKAYGRLPRGDCALTIGANSQHSQSNTLVEIDFIEFRKSRTPKIENMNIAERKIANEQF